LAITLESDPRDREHGGDQTRMQRALFQWAERVLEHAGLLKMLRDAMTLEELDAIKFDAGNSAVILAIVAALHPGKGKTRARHFENMSDKFLNAILKNRFDDRKKDEKKKLIEGEQQKAADEEVREKAEENARFYSEFKKYKVLDHGGVFVLVDEELKTGDVMPKWVQISRTRIELMAVTRSKRDDSWGVYVRIVNMDGRVTRRSIPRNVINDTQGNVAGQLADLGVDVVQDQREHLPAFLLNTVEIIDDVAQDLPRFLCVPTTGWCELNNGRHVFILPHTTKCPADLPADELAIFQNKNLHLQHGFAIEGTIEDWCSQIATPFSNNSNVTLAVGVAFSGPLTIWAGVPPGMFHIFGPSKHAKSLVSAIGQSVYGRPLIPNETIDDPFGMSWLGTVNSIGESILVRSSLPAFIEELNQGKVQDIADAAYRIANGLSKGRMRGRDLEPRITYCVVGFSTGEEPMVSFLERAGQPVTAGMRTRFADIHAVVQPGSVFEKFNRDEIPELAKKYYSLLSKFYGAVGDAWLQILVDMGPEKIEATVSHHQQEFRARPGIQTIYKDAAPHQRSVIDRFVTVAAACRMAIEAGLLPWKIKDTDPDIEACVKRWAAGWTKYGNDDISTDADIDGDTDAVAAAIINFMSERQTWKGTAAELFAELDGAVASPESLGHWLGKRKNLRQLKAVHIKVSKTRDETPKRSRLINFERIAR
jgi:hypothetical protein